MRTIMVKCVMHVTKPNVIDACGSLQVCAGHQNGSQIAIHAMRSIFDADETASVLFIDASNAFSPCQPQACYAAFTFGFRQYCWTYFLRKLPDIALFLEPLERAINEVLIPPITDHTITKVERYLSLCVWGALDLLML